MEKTNKTSTPEEIIQAVQILLIILILICAWTIWVNDKIAHPSGNPRFELPEDHVGQIYGLYCGDEMVYWRLRVTSDITSKDDKSFVYANAWIDQNGTPKNPTNIFLVEGEELSFTGCDGEKIEVARISKLIPGTRNIQFRVHNNYQIIDISTFVNRVYSPLTVLTKIEQKFLNVMLTICLQFFITFSLSQYINPPKSTNNLSSCLNMSILIGLLTFQMYLILTIYFTVPEKIMFAVTAAAAFFCSQILVMQKNNYQKL